MIKNLYIFMHITLNFLFIGNIFPLFPIVALCLIIYPGYRAARYIVLVLHVIIYIDMHVYGISDFCQLLQNKYHILNNDVCVDGS